MFSDGFDGAGGFDGTGGFGGCCNSSSIVMVGGTPESTACLIFCASDVVSFNGGLPSSRSADRNSAGDRSRTGPGSKSCDDSFRGAAHDFCSTYAPNQPRKR